MEATVRKMSDVPVAGMNRLFYTGGDNRLSDGRSFPAEQRLHNQGEHVGQVVE
jgi:hypothetical protein